MLQVLHLDSIFVLFLENAQHLLVVRNYCVELYNHQLHKLAVIMVMQELYLTTMLEKLPTIKVLGNCTKDQQVVKWAHDFLGMFILTLQKQQE